MASLRKLVALREELDQVIGSLQEAHGTRRFDNPKWHAQQAAYTSRWAEHEEDPRILAGLLSAKVSHTLASASHGTGEQRRRNLLAAGMHALHAGKQFMRAGGKGIGHMYRRLGRHLEKRSTMMRKGRYAGETFGPR